MPGGLPFDEFPELLLLEDPRILGEEAEEEPDEIDLERMSLVAGLPEPVVEASRPLGGHDVGRVLRTDLVRLVPRDEPEPPDVLVEIAERELGRYPGFKIVQTEAGEVRNQDVPGKVPFLQPRKVVSGLCVCPIEVLPARFLFDKEDPLPQEVDVPVLPVDPLDFFFEGGDTPAGIPKKLKNPSQNDFPSASSEDSSAHSLENSRARGRISFQLSGIGNRRFLFVGMATSAPIVIRLDLPGNGRMRCNGPATEIRGGRLPAKHMEWLHRKVHRQDVRRGSGRRGAPEQTLKIRLIRPDFQGTRRLIGIW